MISKYSPMQSRHPLVPHSMSGGTWCKPGPPPTRHRATLDLVSSAAPASRRSSGAWCCCPPCPRRPVCSELPSAGLWHWAKRPTHLLVDIFSTVVHRLPHPLVVVLGHRSGCDAWILAILGVAEPRAEPFGGGMSLEHHCYGCLRCWLVA